MDFLIPAGGDFLCSVPFCTSHQHRFENNDTGRCLLDFRCMPGTGSRKGNGRFLRTISNYSYEVFLVHHIIIYFITPRAIPYMRGMVGVLGLFLVELLLMAVLGFLLKSISDQCIAALSNLTAVENKR